MAVKIDRTSGQSQADSTPPKPAKPSKASAKTSGNKAASPDRTQILPIVLGVAVALLVIVVAIQLLGNKGGGVEELSGSTTLTAPRRNSGGSSGVGATGATATGGVGRPAVMGGTAINRAPLGQAAPPAQGGLGREQSEGIGN